jgi:cysteinyl-tRNA synthetase
VSGLCWVFRQTRPQPSEVAVGAKKRTPLPPGHPHLGATRGRSQLASRSMREVRIKDTLTGDLVSLDSKAEVGIYACGPTVYSRIHIGNARPFVVFSLLARFLKSEGYEAKLVFNVTDINDKIYDAARAAGEPSGELAERLTKAYFEDTDRLDLERPDAEPLATEAIGAIVALIADLVESDHAYESGGDVYFRVRSFDDYGKLSNRRTQDMDQGEEAGSASLKEDPLDFALWKAHKEGEDTSWDSPWGPGRPGWHIECSAMAEAELGPSFAIHGGGSDLVFPHHENEIAQSGAAGRPFARLWMHNGMVETDAEKMSKSEGNIFQLSEALDRYGREAVVAYLISGHYRQPLAFGAEQMEQATAQVERLRNFFREHPVGGEGGSGEGSPEQQRGGSAEPSPDSRLDAFRDALADDFNTPRAMAEAFELVGEANRGEVPGASQALAEMLDLLGLGSLAQPDEGAEADERAKGLMEEREKARADKDFARADEIRDRLAELGWEVRDSAEGAKLVSRERT